MCSSKHVKKQKPTYYHGFSHLTFRDNDISTISVTTFTFSLFIHPGLNSAPIMSSVEDEMRSRSPSQAQHRPHLSLNLMFWFFTYWHSIEKLNLTVSIDSLTEWLYIHLFGCPFVSMVTFFSSIHAISHSWWIWTLNIEHGGHEHGGHRHGGHGHGGHRGQCFTGVTIFQKFMFTTQNLSRLSFAQWNVVWLNNKPKF